MSVVRSCWVWIKNKTGGFFKWMPRSPWVSILKCSNVWFGANTISGNLHMEWSAIISHNHRASIEVASSAHTIPKPSWRPRFSLQKETPHHPTPHHPSIQPSTSHNDFPVFFSPRSAGNSPKSWVIWASAPGRTSTWCAPRPHRHPSGCSLAHPGWSPGGGAIPHQLKTVVYPQYLGGLSPVFIGFQPSKSSKIS